MSASGGALPIGGYDHDPGGLCVVPSLPSQQGILWLQESHSEALSLWSWLPVPLKAPNIVAECYGDLTSVLLLSSGQTLFGSWVAGQGGEGSPQWPGAFLTLT